MEEFVAYIVKNLVSNPDAVVISSVNNTDSETIRLEIKVDPEDIGKVIGRRGNTIHALRTIFRRVCSRVKKKIEIDLIQPEGYQKPSNHDTVNEFCDLDQDMIEEAAQDYLEEEVSTTTCSGHCGCHSS